VRAAAMAERCRLGSVRSDHARLEPWVERRPPMRIRPRHRARS
jgi:hypothetical protein